MLYKLSYHFDIKKFIEDQNLLFFSLYMLNDPIIV